ncbi:MAG: 16S rRNA (guanine(527)-N(7))-methyltransferase RsmG [Flavobacteriaceae bacterium]|nr:16S rRNA (guanine(527)-N(7))-methyltransferase RsmG [Flavobacteriaceae bacterium]
MSKEKVSKYFTELSSKQRAQISELERLYNDWNLKINVVSRKDIEQIYLRHVLHSMCIAKFISFKANSNVIDVGTGGGFPGIPLAILFPEVNFTLVDSIGKKLKVVEEVVSGLNLSNVKTIQSRAEDLTSGQFDFVVSRAVAYMPTFVHWTQHLLSKKNRHQIANGILYLKGGDLEEELSSFPKSQIYELTDWIHEEEFQTKKLVYLPL